MGAILMTTQKTSFCEELASDEGLGVDAIVEECCADRSPWNGGASTMPNTMTLRRMILLAEWASREPKRWAAYKMYYIDGIKSSTEIAQKLHIADRTARRYLEPVYLKRQLQKTK